MLLVVGVEHARPFQRLGVMSALAQGSSVLDPYNRDQPANFDIGVMLRKIKLLALHAANRSGASSLVMNSAWRRRRLLILCYHGISQEDEHLWSPSLYMAPDLLRQRMAALQASDCNVLRLDEGIER